MNTNWSEELFCFALFSCFVFLNIIKVVNAMMAEAVRASCLYVYNLFNQFLLCFWKGVYKMWNYLPLLKGVENCVTKSNDKMRNK